MKYLKSWLKDYIEIQTSDSELILKLNTTGTEIESTEKLIDENIVIVKILEIKPHPKADRLRLVKVTDGEDDYEIVCGASNIKLNQIVPMARVGAHIGGRKLEKALIRGVESNGMLCSEQELGLGDDHSGIFILNETYKIGESLSKYLDADMVIEAEITTNRGDCLSHRGLAREISAFTSKPLKKEENEIEKGGAPNLEIEIEDQGGCPRYFAQEIDKVKIGSSPDFLVNRLNHLDVKSINNLVDITNYIMFDLGHPLHVFDADKIVGNKIVIRRARKNEEITLLDGKTVKLETSDLVIADRDKALALAGIMGGLETGATQSTRRIILEAAEFKPSIIRKTSKRLGIVSEASYRFERGIDSNGILAALNKASKMTRDYAGGEIQGSYAFAGVPYQEEKIELQSEKINRLLGLQLSNQEIEEILIRLGFKISNNWLTIPSWRHDIESWQDLAEEVGRIYGLEKLPRIKLPKAKTPPKSIYYAKEYLKDLLVGDGFIEVKNYPFLSQADVESTEIEVGDLLEVSNPVQRENKYLRNSLGPALLKNVARNGAFDPILLFEIGNVFTKERETVHLGLVVSGKGAGQLIKNGQKLLSSKLQTSEIQIKKIDREELKRLKIRKPEVYLIEVSLDRLFSNFKPNDQEIELKLEDKKINFKPISKFPLVTRDLAFIVNNKTDSAEIEEEIVNTSELINHVELFDEFSSDKFGQNKKNVAFHIFMQHPDMTLTDEKASQIINEIINRIETKFSAKLRES
jgi:phenylalanyl-tRNA synthetase beta chain